MKVIEEKRSVDIMEVIYSASSSAWIGITGHEGRFVVVDGEKYEYADYFSNSILFRGTYNECKQYADVWYAETKETF